MSYISYIGGKYIETTGGDSLIYARENIVTNSQGPIEITSGEGIFFGEPEIYESNETLKGVKVTASIFFDGTKNNRNNTFRRLDKNTKSDTSEKSKTVYSETKEADSSYENGYSNVAALSYMATYDKENRIVRTYIEGQGTENDQKGFDSGFAFGAGTTGIPAKATKGYGLINVEISKVINPKEYVRTLTLNVFGFSRGAAAARHFITSTKASFKSKYPKAKIEYKFVGLFDSVSSYEPTSDGKWSKLGSGLSHDFTNDVDELGLALGGIPEKVVHLTAGDEYRENFALTTIASSINAGVGYELQLPGAHSDIGGGYEEYTHTENRKYFGEITDTDQNEKFYYHQLIENGWYKEAQLKLRTYVDFSGTRNLNNKYQFVSLAIMMEFAKKNGMLFESFDLNLQNKEFKVIPELEDIKDSLLDYALANDGAVATKATINSKPLLKKLRNEYLHISVNMSENVYGIKTMAPRFVDKKQKRLPIEG
jgi:hypothetical protein